jgi:serine protease Do
MRELFLEIKGEFDPDLEAKIDAAIELNTDKITFTTEEFERFRSNPINPFDGLEDIDVNSLNGKIQLKFEVPTVRNRPVGIQERQNPDLLAELRGVVSCHSHSVVEILDGSKSLCLGTVIDSRGTVITKASELDGAKKLRIRDFTGSQFDATVYKTEPHNDVALLQTQATHLPAIAWDDEQPVAGDFLVSCGVDGDVISLGSYSHIPRSLADSEKGFLGVTPQNVAEGVVLTEVTPDSAADQAGLKVGDVVVGVNGESIRDVASLVARVQSSKAGESVQISFLRNGVSRTTNATLAGRSLSSDRAARFKMMNRLGAIPSQRAQDFPWVFQHDSPLLPEQCGSPVFNLDGKVVGLNIARQGRVSSLGLPSRHVQTLLNEMLREDVASSEGH